jgi:hypothetical protein
MIHAYKKNKFNICLIMCCLTISACAQNEKPENNIQLSESHDFLNEFKLSDMVDDVNYIPLETNENCLIGRRYSAPHITDNSNSGRKNN